MSVPNLLLSLNRLDATALCLSLTTVWWGARQNSHLHRILLATLGAVGGCLAARLFDRSISILLIGAAVVLEVNEVILTIRTKKGTPEKNRSPLSDQVS